LDGALQTAAAAFPEFGHRELSAWLPVGLERLTRRSINSPVARAHVKLRDRSREHVMADIALMAADGTVSMTLEGLKLRNPRGRARSADSPPVREKVWVYRDIWEAEPAPSEVAHAARWLLLADRNGEAEAVAAHLRSVGDEAILVHQRGGFGRIGDDCFRRTSRR
jgi:hypothetical protein